MAVEVLRCRVCETEYPPIAAGTCERCFGPLEPSYDWDALASEVSREIIEAGPRSLWRYEQLLPVGAPENAATGPGGQVTFGSQASMGSSFILRAITQSVGESLGYITHAFTATYSDVAVPPSR